LALPPIDQEKLTMLLAAASGPNRQSGEAFPQSLTPNQHWPNNQQHWAYQFAPKAANGIADVVDETNKSLQAALEKYLKDLNSEMNSYVEAIKSNLEQVTHQIIQTSISASQRTNLLWWKESLYSPSIKQSYRALPPSVAMLALAFDLSKQVSPLYPMSVDFFLKETAVELLTHSNEPNKVSELSFTDLIDQLQSEINQQVVAQLLNNAEIKRGRISLVTYLRSVIHTKNETDGDPLQRIGVSGEQKIALPDFAVWCFRIFQVEQLTAAEAE
ncbi:MAG TPA: GTPase-associated system all-helical protein GASH, partial [Cyclobacteriaceae bacterium]|nr:GTPase-associated system all-helical protein GASH [Cyclobacteriaceae bacterium]